MGEAAARAIGRAARAQLPGRLGRWVVRQYARRYGVDLREVDPLALDAGYPTLDAFFTRRLRSGIRVVDRSPDTLVSPSDGTLREVVDLADEPEVTVKGHTFTLAELLANPDHAARFRGGKLASIYLHPRDYHRVHCPADALGHEVTLVPGRLLPVNDAAVERVPNLFARNERMIHVLECGLGPLAVVMVAAFGVGHMTCSYARIEPHARKLRRYTLDPPVRLAKGDEIGVFHLGSTVLVAVPPGIDAVAAAGRIRFGMPLFREAGR